MTIYAWIDYGYYDGNLYFSRLYARCDDDRITSWRVSWLGSEESNTESKP